MYHDQGEQESHKSCHWSTTATTEPTLSEPHDDRRLQRSADLHHSQEVTFHCPFHILCLILMGERIHIYEQTWEEVFIFMSRVPCGTKPLSWCMILPWLYQAPGHSSPFSCMVASAQSEAPHFMSVPKQFTGQFLCDSQCPMFGAYKICSHTLNPVESQRIGRAHV